MKKVLDGLKLKQDIIGAYIFHAKGGVAAKNMPDDFTDTRLTAIAEKIIKLFSSGLKKLKDVPEVSLVYEESIVTICEITDHYYLIILFLPYAEPGLVPMVLQPAIDELKSLIVKGRREDARKPEKSENRLSESFDEKNPAIDSERLMASSAMASVLKELQVTLTKVVGPIAKIIFMDSLKVWIATDHPDLSTIPNLLDILRREINDPEKFNTYRKEIMPHVWMGS